VGHAALVAFVRRLWWWGLPSRASSGAVGTFTGADAHDRDGKRLWRPAGMSVVRPDPEHAPCGDQGPGRGRSRGSGSWERDVIGRCLSRDVDRRRGGVVCRASIYTRMIKAEYNSQHWCYRSRFEVAWRRAGVMALVRIVVLLRLTDPTPKAAVSRIAAIAAI